MNQLKNRYLIEYENAHWCGGQLNVVVWAPNEDEARILASDHMEECQRELYSDQYGESVDEDGDEEYVDETAVSINTVELLNEEHPDWEYFIEASQQEFYPIVGMPY
jgi:hypothetical protein